MFPSFLPPSLPPFLPSFLPSVLPSFFLSNPMFFYPRKSDPEKNLLIPNLFDPTNFLTPIPHNTLTHNFPTHNLLTHNLLTHNTPTHTHTQLLHTQLTHNSLAHFAERRGTRRHRPSLCGPGMALMALALVAPAWSFVWQALHLVTSTFTLCGRCGTYGSGDALGRGWSAMTPRSLCGRRGTW